jgi:excisionase family DNA binding protein
MTNNERAAAATQAEGLVTSKPAAARLAVCERTLWKLTASGEIRCVRIGRAKRYDVKDLDAFIERKKSALYFNDMQA